MQVVVPFAAETPKTRLASTLSASERSRFAHTMLADVLEAIRDAGQEPTVVATAPLEAQSDDPTTGVESGDDRPVDPPAADEVSVVVDDRPLTAAVDARLPGAGEEPVAVVMADLALATPAALERLFSTAGDVVIAPGRGGGTNALVVREPGFSVDYHGASYRDHCRIAREVGATLATVDSFRLGTDVDEPDDLVEVLLHAEGHSAALLREFGFALETDEGRVTVTRSNPL